MSSRRRAREIVLQLLYEADVNEPRSPEDAREFIRSRMQGRTALTAFAESVYAGTLKHREDVDRHLARLAKGWTLSRMAITDRNVMRMAAYEILFSETPGTVAVNEAVVLIKRYGDKNSPRFVNGILDRLLKEFNAPAPVVETEQGTENSPEG
ncbi:transcription antitermination factor NusB [Rhodopirellula sp. MGV]|uniref:transcription antitermination factor NusB n=1 Tax=Rhodopirellula sp. MGV TaxID=2023130 RepID=UPI000B974AD7|nr:transcription antitermination factor NusB [Rhodopirellula sp. MGV]OYP34192.1 transcription antitermination factor NusB [Rhodopirellula sp. MGV]PNY33627.1 transcription antitermination factor NusB [Rhodopirellula baltica]